MFDLGLGFGHFGCSSPLPWCTVQWWVLDARHSGKWGSRQWFCGLESENESSISSGKTFTIVSLFGSGVKVHHLCHGAECGGEYQMLTIVGNGGPSNDSVP